MSEAQLKTLKIENIVASGSIAETLDLTLISTKIENCVLNTKRFPGAVYRIADPKCAILIFSSGKVVITGVKTHEDLAEDINILIQKLEEIGIICFDEPTVPVTNIVCSYDLGNNINLNKITISLLVENVEYEPEVFPGLVYRIPAPKIVALLFSSGKLILTGARTIDDVKSGLDFLEQKLRSII